MGEIGNYICASNNNWCAFSYDDDDQYNTAEPMTKFGPARPITSGPIPFTIDDKWSNWYRFWTLMEWLKHNYGKVDIKSIQDFAATHYYCDKDGKRIDYFRDPMTKNWLEAKYSGYSVCQHQPYPDTCMRGTKDVTIYELGAQGNVKIYQSFGRPCEWEGPWDEYLPFARNIK